MSHRELSIDAIRRASVVASLEEARLYRAAQARQDRAQASHNAARGELLDAVRSGVDRPLRICGPRGSAYPVSAFIGEPVCDAKAVLLAAARHALLQDDAAAAHLLRQFVEAVADDYASDNAEAYE